MSPPKPAPPPHTLHTRTRGPFPRRAPPCNASQASLERASRAKDAAESRVLELESALRAAERLVASLQAGSSADAIK